MMRTPINSLSALIVATCAASGAGPASAFVVDGRLDAQYQFGFSVTFDTNNGPVPGGKLAFGHDAAGAQYLYFGMPKDFVDNTYGRNEIGWDTDPNKVKHKFDSLLGSDSLGDEKGGQATAFILHTANGDLELAIDYLASNSKDAVDYVKGKNPTAPPASAFSSGGIGFTNGLAEDTAFTEKNDGSVISEPAPGDAASVIAEVRTSLETNVGTFADANPDVLVDSPAATVNPDGSYTADDPAFSDWIYEVAYELKFDPGTFDSAKWNNVTTASAALELVALGESHVSPAKSTFQGTTVDDQCSFGSDPRCGGGGTQTVPEPGSMALMAMGIAGMACVRRRRTPVRDRRS